MSAISTSIRRATTSAAAAIAGAAAGMGCSGAGWPGTSPSGTAVWG